MLWYLFVLVLWRLLYDVVDSFRLKVTWVIVLVFIILSALIGFVPWIGHTFAFSRFVFFAPYFFLGIVAKEYKIIDFINKHIDLNLSIMTLLFTLLLAIVAQENQLNIREIFFGASSYPKGSETMYMIARLLSYVVSTAVSVCFIRIFSLKIPFFAKIGADSLKFYMFHGLLILLIISLDLPWSSLYAIAYAVFSIVLIYFFNLTQLSDFAIRPVSFFLYKKVDN